MRISLVVTILLLNIASCKDNSPIIGVLMLSPDKTFPRKSAFVATSYIKWIEQSGFRWMPISMFDTTENIIDKLNVVDGMLFTGGKLNLTKLSKKGKLYMSVVKTILNYAMARNDKGNPFAVLGICLGFEAMLSSIIGPDYKFIAARDVNKVRPVYFTNIAMESPYLSKVFSRKQLRQMSGRKFFYFHHKFAADLAASSNNPTFTSNFSILAAMNSTDNKQIVAMVQHHHYPFLGMQFHPEKVQFEHYDKSVTCRCVKCMQISQKLSIMMRHMIGMQKVNALKTADLAVHKYRLYYQAEYKNYDEIIVDLPSAYRPSFERLDNGSAVSVRRA